MAKRALSHGFVNESKWIAAGKRQTKLKALIKNQLAAGASSVISIASPKKNSFSFAIVSYAVMSFIKVLGPNNTLKALTTVRWDAPKRGAPLS